MTEKPKLTFTQKEILNKTIVIMLVRGVDAIGFPRFYFLGIKANNVPKLEEAMKSEGVNLEDHGVIIEHGFGLPSDEVWAKMKENYGLEKDKIVILNNKP